MLEQHLTQLSAELELGSLPPKDEGKMYHLSFNSGLRISFKELDPGMFLYAPIGKCPAEKREELYMHLMKANFLGQGTGGSVIGLDPDENLLTLSFTLPYDMNYKAFKEHVEDFANYVDYWKEELLRHQEEAKKTVYS